ncbi:MAG: hypothetical protein WC643_01345 [Parcubacteria group bacterium]|jgi:hypothetical protein
MRNINLNKLLVPLFEKAKEIDEFEFCCTILRVKGTEGPGWDPLAESSQFMNQTALLLQAPLESDLKKRLLLSLYCHATEIDDIYIIISNLLRIIKGERYSIDYFRYVKDKNGNKVKYPHHKIDEIKNLAKDTDFEKIAETMDYFLVKEVRNAFYHSDYVLYKEEFNIRHGDGVLIENIITPAVPFEWLIPRAHTGINFAFETIKLTQKYRRSYKKEKVVSARFLADGGVEDLMLTVHPKAGLIGFRSLKEEERNKYDKTRKKRRG